MSYINDRSHWLKTNIQKLMTIALPIAAVVSFLPMILRFISPHFTLVYLASAQLMAFLVILAISKALLGFQNEKARRLAQILLFTGLLGGISGLWLIIENLFLGLPLSYPNWSIIIAAIANFVLVFGLIFITAEHRRRSRLQYLGYVLMTLLFIICILAVYSMNLIFNPPFFPAVGAEVRILLGYLTLMFAWSFYFNQDPPKTIIGRTSRILLIITSLILLLGYTLFALQYALNYLTISVFYYAGSVSDIVSLFAITLLLLTVMLVFIENLDKPIAAQSLSLQYESLTTLFVLTSIFILVFITATFIIVLIRQILLTILPYLDAILITQGLSVGILLGVLLLILGSGGLSYYLIKMLYQPLKKLEAQTTKVTEPGTTSYKDPPGLIFAELQSLSENYSQLIDQLRRVQTELRTTDLQPGQIPSSITQQARLDFYLAILDNSISNSLQTILSLSELLERSVGEETDHAMVASIKTEITEMKDLLRTIQILRIIDNQPEPELNRITLTPVIAKIVNELQDLLSDQHIQISLNLPEGDQYVLANEYLYDIFKALLIITIQSNLGQEGVVEVSIYEVTEHGQKYWQINIANRKWMLPDVEKELLFRYDKNQPQMTHPSHLLIPTLIEYFNGKWRINNLVQSDPRYGTVIEVLLPKATRRS